MIGQTEITAPEVEIAKPAPPKFVGDRPRFRTVPLEWPVEYDGKVYDSITVRRMTTRQVSEFFDGSGRLPMFDEPFEVIDALDDDDAANLNKAVEDFLPQRLRRMLGSSPISGEATSQSPQQDSADSKSTA